MGGQGEASIGMQGRARKIALGAALILATALVQTAHAQQDDASRPTPSGLPVPRYVTLKFGEVNARAGPGDDHRLLWIYHARGLPVQVVAETSDWRRVCDPEGGLAWVHKRTTDGRRMVLRMSSRPLALHRKPKAESAISAYLAPRALASLVRCKNDWCRIRVDGVTAWAPIAGLWGADERPQCR